MADTIRTLAELNSLLADNDNQGISAQDLRDLMVSMMVYGEIGSGTKSQIVLGNGYQPLDFNVAGVVDRGVTVDTTNKWISDIPVNMRCEVTLEVMFQGSINTTFDFAVFKNPDGTPEQLQRVSASQRIFNAAQVGVISISAVNPFNAGDKIQAGVRANGANFTLVRGVLRLKRLGVE